MNDEKDLCAECLHLRSEHQGMVGCKHTEKDRLGFVREICECEKFVEDVS